MLVKGEKRYYLLFENWMVLIHLKLNLHHPRMLCTKFRSWEFGFKVCQYIFTISLLSPLEKRPFIWTNIIISPWKRALPFIWTNLNPHHPRMLCAKFGWNYSPVVLKNKIFKVCQCIFSISLLSPLGKGRGPSFEQTWITITQECFVPSLVEIGPVVLEMKMKMWKVYKQTDRGMDRQTVGRRTTGDQKSSLELSAQVS